MPAKKTPALAKSKSRSSRRSKSSKSSRKASRSKNTELVGTFESIVMKNGIGKKTTGKINKAGKQYNVKTTNIKEELRPVSVRVIRMPNPGPAFFF